MSELMSPEEYAARHRKAFRSAFDFLESHFPPECSGGWWEKTSCDLKTLTESDDNVLTRHLLMALIDYLEEESKKRRNT